VSFSAELGDYSPTEHGEHYLLGYQLLLNNNSGAQLRRVGELHRLHRGQTPAEAEFNFLEHAKRLDMYGVDLFEAKARTVLAYVKNSSLGRQRRCHSSRCVQFRHRRLPKQRQVEHVPLVWRYEAVVSPKAILRASQKCRRKQCKSRPILDRAILGQYYSATRI
jgi:hypothetical protein